MTGTLRERTEVPVPETLLQSSESICLDLQLATQTRCTVERIDAPALARNDATGRALVALYQNE